MAADWGNDRRRIFASAVPKQKWCAAEIVRPLQPRYIQLGLTAVPYLGSSVKLLSLNVALPRLALYHGKTINTAIYKQPVAGPVQLRTLNLDGDRQADLSVHGGLYKAVYGYPSEHYPLWREELPGIDLPWGRDLPWGSFGENFTTEGLFESDLHIGDRLRIGPAILMVRQPRMPCYKLAAKFQRDDMIDLFLRSGRSGFYFSVEQEGEVQQGDCFELISKNPEGITIA